jgi:hypothetical protein
VVCPLRSCRDWDELPASFPTIEDLFAEIEKALDHEEFGLRPTYDNEVGFPFGVTLDLFESAVDHFMVMHVSKFETLLTAPGRDPRR